MRRDFGQWSLASDPEVKVPGVFQETAPGVYRLELSGALSDSIDDSGEHRLLGWLESWEQVTLEGCHCSPAGSLSEKPRQTWYPHQAIFGVHIENSNPWSFYAASFSMPGLTYWVSRANLAYDIEHENGRPRAISFFVPIETWPLWTADDCVTSLCRTCGTNKETETSLQIESRVDVRGCGVELLSEDDFHRVVTRPLQVLVALSTGEFTAATKGKVAVEKVEAGGQARYFEWHWRPLAVDFDPSSVEYAFHYSDMTALGSDTLHAWAGKASKLSAVLDLYLAVLQKTGFAELKFLMAVQALEVYHRGNFDLTVLPHSDWNSVKENLIYLLQQTQLPVDLESKKEQLIGKLGHFNEVSLAVRLKALLDLIPDQTKEICGGSRGNFVAKVVATRNFFTHWSQNDGVKPLERGRELFVATNRLIAMLELLLLREVGFPVGGVQTAEVLRRRVSWL